MLQALHDLEFPEDVPHLVPLDALLLVHVLHRIHFLGVSLLHDAHLGAEGASPRRRPGSSAGATETAGLSASGGTHLLRPQLSTRPITKPLTLGAGLQHVDLGTRSGPRRREHDAGRGCSSGRTGGGERETRPSSLQGSTALQGP